MLETYAQQAAVTAKAEYGVTIPWEQILELVMTLIDQCFDNEEDFVKAAKDPTWLQRIAMNVMVRRVLDLRGRRKVVAVANSVFSTAQDMSEEQLVGAFQECQAVFGSKEDKDTGNGV